ncbi:MAG TPA: AAA family ATPase, partial [Roseiflexaceae bacterium]|nr:AAA family ATPase [Roseiflexaceae bacterium]
ADERRAALQAAVALYHDDLLTGFTLRDSPAFDDWQITQGERFRRLLADTLQQLSDLQAREEDWLAAITSAQRWLALDPLHEEAHRTLMILHARAGQRSAAIQQYRNCVRILERELGVPPLDETTSLYETIIAGALPPPHPVPLMPPIAAPPPSAPPPLIGRDAEWAALLQCYTHIGPDGALIAIAGPAGVGKTRLATEFLEHARSRSAVTLYARCYEGETGLAFAPFVTLLRAVYALPNSATRLAGIPDWLRSAAAHLVPELAERPAILPPDHADARLRLFEGVAAVLCAATAGSNPALVLIDDLQWADRSSLDLFAFLARRLHGQPLGLIAAWRDDDLPPIHQLHSLLAALRRDQAVLHLPLTPLSHEATTTLIDTSLGMELPAAIYDRLFAETEGLPLLLVAYLDMLRAGGTPEPDADWHMPEVARDLLQARLQRASPLGAQLLAAAAVIGRTFDNATLQLVSGRSEDEIISGLEELIGLGIVIEGQAYDFSHGKLRELTYAATSLARRRLLHRRAAEALTEHPTDRNPAALAALVAQHYQLAGQDTHAAQAFARAGRYAHELADIATALSHYTTAAALGHPDPGSIQLAIGDRYTLEGHYPRALTSYASAAAHAEPSELALIEARIAEIYRRRGEWDLALQHLDAGLATLETPATTGLHARLTADQSLTAYQAGDRVWAQQLAHAAHNLAQQARDTRALAQAHNLQGLLARATGDPAGACVQLERSLALAEQL